MRRGRAIIKRLGVAMEALWRFPPPKTPPPPGMLRQLERGPPVTGLSLWPLGAVGDSEACGRTQKSASWRNTIDCLVHGYSTSHVAGACVRCDLPCIRHGWKREAHGAFAQRRKARSCRGWHSGSRGSRGCSTGGCQLLDTLCISPRGWKR